MSSTCNPWDRLICFCKSKHIPFQVKYPKCKNEIYLIQIFIIIWSLLKTTFRVHFRSRILFCIFPDWSHRVQDLEKPGTKGSTYFTVRISIFQTMSLDLPRVAIRLFCFVLLWNCHKGLEYIIQNYTFFLSDLLAELKCTVHLYANDVFRVSVAAYVMSTILHCCINNIYDLQFN